jgi:hypothetical protein
MNEDQHEIRTGTSLKQGMIYLLIIIFAAIFLSFFLTRGVMRHASNWQEKFAWLAPKPDRWTLTERIPESKLDGHITKLKKDIQSLNYKLRNYTPYQSYLVVNTANNTFKLMKNGRTIREGICSTGSYTILTAGENQKWVFETPRGELRVLGKEKSPVWVKPDWAFIEEGLPVPPPGHHSRYERGVLGDYKLMLGRGYLIHGTLYKRFLGMAVTHGCIRMGDDDLEAVYKNLQIGSKVFIY